MQREFDPPGTVQTFDSRTGQRRWVFFTIPQSSDDFGADTWEDESWRYTSHANVWGLMPPKPVGGSSTDRPARPAATTGEATGRGLTCSPSPWCASMRTPASGAGHFQGVNHGLWDYDLAAAPNLAAITVEGREIDAADQVSMQGFTYVLDRVTGEPVWPIEERPVDTDTDVPG